MQYSNDMMKSTKNIGDVEEIEFNDLANAKYAFWVLICAAKLLINFHLTKKSRNFAA